MVRYIRLNVKEQKGTFGAFLITTGDQNFCNVVLERVSFSCALIPQWVVKGTLCTCVYSLFCSQTTKWCWCSAALTAYPAHLHLWQHLSFLSGLVLSCADVCLQQTRPLVHWSVMMQRRERCLRIAFLIFFSFTHQAWNYPERRIFLCWLLYCSPSSCPTLVAFSLFIRKHKCTHTKTPMPL